MLKPHAPALLPAPASRGFGGVVFLVLFVVLAVMACLKFLALHSTVFDLGVFLSNLHSLHNAGQWWRAFLGHAQPLLPLYAQVYRLVPDQAAPLVLLTVQALVLALPALWAARRYGLLAALAYALYYPVWTNALFDFHLDHLLIPILFAFLAAATSGRYGLAFVLGLLPALVKEPYALTTVFCGLYLLVAAGRSRAGWGLVALGSLYFYVATGWVIPFCTVDGGLGAESGAFAWLGGGPGSALMTFALHPGDVLATVFGVPGKWKYLGFLFGALLFFPLFRPKLLLPAVPALALALLAAQPNYYGWANHYTAGAAGAVFFAFCEVLGPVRILARQSAAGMQGFGMLLVLALSVGHVLLAPSPVSRLFLTTDNFAFSIEAYEPTARDAGILAAIIKSIPNDPNVPVVSQNTLNWGALAERLDYNSFPLGVFAPHPVRDLSQATWKDFWIFVRTRQTPNLPVRAWQARYVLLDMTRPWFVLDRGCEFQNGVCRDKAVAEEFTALVARARQELETVYDENGFCILRRPEPEPEPAPVPAQTETPPGEAASDSGETPAPAGPPTPAAPVAPPTPGQPQPSSPDSTPTPARPTPRQTPTPPASQAIQPAPPAGDEVQVEVLDRFPTLRPGKKLKPDVPAQGGEQPATSGETPAPAERKKPDAATTVAPDAPATGDGSSQPVKQPRRRKAPTEQPGATGEAPTGQTAPDAATTVVPDAPATGDGSDQPVKRPRRRKAPTEQPGATGEAPAGQTAPDAATTVAPAGEAPSRPVRQSRRQKETIEIPVPQQPSSGGDHAP
jgi:uncharacterized membrane protein